MQSAACRAGKWGLAQGRAGRVEETLLEMSTPARFPVPSSQKVQAVLSLSHQAYCGREPCVFEAPSGADRNPSIGAGT